MTFLQSVLLGLLQGLTEFLPVSSSAHLILAQEWFQMEDPDLLFSVLVHLGTLTAVCIAFRTTIAGLIKEALRTIRDLFRGNLSFREASSGRKMLFWLLLSLAPLLIVYPLQSLIDPLLVSPLVAGVCLIFNALILILCDMAPNGTKHAKNMTWRDSIFVGLIQCAAILPGLSRSGATITAGVCSGMKRSFAAKYSFLLSIPTILGGAVLEIVDAIGTGIDPAKLPVYLAGMIAAALSGLGAIKLLQLILKSKRFLYFSVYSFVVGIAAIIVAL